VMFLEAGTRAHFMTFMAREFPALVPRYEKLYVKKYAPKDYRKQVQGMVRLLQQRYGIAKREDATHDTGADGPAPPEHAEPEQVGFAW